jgi:hypothetical protein
VVLLNSELVNINVGLGFQIPTHDAVGSFFASGYPEKTEKFFLSGFY